MKQIKNITLGDFQDFYHASLTQRKIQVFQIR